MYEFVGVAWAVMAIVASSVAVAHLVVYVKDIKWQRKNYLWDYVDKKFDVVLVEKEERDG